MAQRRMFSKAIIKTDTFLDMPVSAQCLYFHLGIEADDDGFVSPKMVMRVLGSNDDDLKLLIVKEFIYPFESGVIVITHWKENNYIQADRYQATQYQKELRQAVEGGVYKMYTQVRLGKVRKDNRATLPLLSINSKNKLSMIVDYYLDISGEDKTSYSRHLRAAKQLLELCDGNTDRACSALDKTKAWVAGFGGEEWKIETTLKRWMELKI